MLVSQTNKHDKYRKPQCAGGPGMCSESNITRVLIVEDESWIRAELAQILEQDTGISVVGEAGNSTDLMTMVDKLRPDVVIMDLSMPCFDCIATIRQILTNCEHTSVVALSVYTDMDRVGDAIRVGALGYVVKAGVSRHLTSAVTAVANGQVYFSPGVSASISQKSAARSMT